MIPRIKVRTEIPYLINANVWGKEEQLLYLYVVKNSLNITISF